VWHTAKAAIPHLRAGGGSIILTSSTAGLMAIPNTGHYTSAKHGVVGLMRTLALELAPDMIRVNSVHPTTVNTDMIQNAATYALFAPDLPENERTREVLSSRFQELNALPIPWVEPVLTHTAGAPPWPRLTLSSRARSTGRSRSSCCRRCRPASRPRDSCDDQRSAGETIPVGVRRGRPAGYEREEAGMSAPGHRVALVTGAARGIGAATVEALAAGGRRVVAVDRCADDPAVPYPLGPATSWTAPGRSPSTAGWR